MSRSPILFRCDATPDLGWDFFYLCLTFGAALQRRRRGTYFLVNLSPSTLAGEVSKAGCEWIPSEHPFGSVDDCEATVKEIHRLGAGGVVLAGPNISQEYLRELTGAGASVTVLDIEGNLEFDSQLVVCPFFAPGRNRYRCSGTSQILHGPRYAVVRGIFRRQRPIRSQEPPAPFRAIVALGETDTTGQSVLRTEELLASSRIEKVSVVARPHHPDYMKLIALAEQNPERMEIICEPNEIGTRLARVHFALTGGDAWSIEIACVGIPQFIISQHDRHEANADRMDDEGAAVYLGRASEVNASMLRSAVHDLLSDPTARLAMSRAARQVVDGRGPDRLVTAIEVMLHRDAPAKPVISAA